MNPIKGIALLVLLLISPICRAQTGEIPLEEKVAQMLILGFKGTEVSDTCEIVRTIRDKGIGGVIF